MNNCLLRQTKGIETECFAEDLMCFLHNVAHNALLVINLLYSTELSEAASQTVLDSGMTCEPKGFQVAAVSECDSDSSVVYALFTVFRHATVTRCRRRESCTNLWASVKMQVRKTHQDLFFPQTGCPSPIFHQNYCHKSATPSPMPISYTLCLSLKHAPLWAR